jgi:MFS family permease
MLGWAFLLHNVFVGLQDVAVDALAVDQLEGGDRERASGMMYCSAYVGTFLGGAGLGIVTARLGLSTAIAAMTAAQAAILAVVLAVRERAAASGDEALATGHAAPAPLAMIRTLVRAMVKPLALRAAVAAFLLKVLPAALSVVMLVQPVERFGLAARGWESTAVVFGYGAADTVCMAAMSVALFSIFMRVASPAVAATQFTASMAIMNLATSVGSWLAGPIGDLVDPPTAFLIAGCIQPLLSLLVPAGRERGPSGSPIA